MRPPRTLIAIPEEVTAGIDRIAGRRNRTHFIVEVLAREIERQEQLASLQEAIGCWRSEDHPELANGSEAFVRNLRQEAAQRLDQIQRHSSE